MDTALTHEFPFILDRNLAKANSTGNRVCKSCDIEVLVSDIIVIPEFFAMQNNNDIASGLNTTVKVIHCIF